MSSATSIASAAPRACGIVRRSGDATNNFGGVRSRMGERVFETMMRRIGVIDPSCRV